MITMNWNLKKTSAFFIFLLVYSNCFAQKNSISKFNFYATIGTVFNGSINSSTSSKMTNGSQTFKQYQDSASSKETWRLTFSPQVGIIYLLSKNVDFQFGLGYLILGHQRQLNNLHYKDPTYPGIGSGDGNGVIIENTNAERNIDLNYRYQYLQIPLILNYHLNLRSLSQNFKIALSGGVGVNILMKHDINAILSSGFKIDEKSSFSVDSTGYKASPISANIMIGAMMDYNYSKQIKFVLQPMLGFFPLSVSSQDLEARPWFVNINIGAIYTLDKLKK